MEFQERIVYRSGLGEETTCPPWLMGHPFFFDMAHARLEFEVTCFAAVQELLTRTGVRPEQIDGLVVNSSLFNPTPSLSAMIMNRFKLRADCANYNLGGMGCSGELVGMGGEGERERRKEMESAAAGRRPGAARDAAC